MGVREKGGLVWSGTISACCGSRLLVGAVDGHQHWPHLAHSSAPSTFRSQLIRWPLRANLASELIGLFPSPWKNKPECCVGILGSCCRIYYLTVLKVKFEMDQQGCVPSPILDSGGHRHSWAQGPFLHLQSWQQSVFKSLCDFCFCSRVFPDSDLPASPSCSLPHPHRPPL